MSLYYNICHLSSNYSNSTQHKPVDLNFARCVILVCSLLAVNQSMVISQRKKALFKSKQTHPHWKIGDSSGVVWVGVLIANNRLWTSIWPTRDWTPREQFPLGHRTFSKTLSTDSALLVTYPCWFIMTSSHLALKDVFFVLSQTNGMHKVKGHHLKTCCTRHSKKLHINIDIWRVRVKTRPTTKTNRRCLLQSSPGFPGVL